tara:strand:+ start:1704 stop:2948 length:1245 start_codon:yes stop_codon:yes gene_type:complete
MTVQPSHITNISSSYFERLKQSFPALVNSDDVIYFDNASSVQKPYDVLQNTTAFYESHYANPGRGVYDWAQTTQNIIENTREKVADFIGASNKSGIIFTSGATMSLNMVAMMWGEHNLQDGDEILYCAQDHHSMVLPWKMLQQKLAQRSIHIKLIPYMLKTNGEVNYNDIFSKVTDKTKMVNVTHVHNVAGVLNDIAYMRANLPAHIRLNVDAAQSISHMPVNVSELGADFLSFSGHKMFSETGIGVLYVAPTMQHECMALFAGGGMAEADDKSSFYVEMEAGTQNLGGIISLGAAIDFIENIGRTRIHAYMQELTTYLYQALLKNPRVDMIFPVKEYDLQTKQGIAAFRIEGFEESEIGDFLADNKIFVRYGQHCAGADPNKDLQDSIRLSLHIYNTKQDIDRFINLLQKIKS